MAYIDVQHEGVLYQRYKDPKPAAQLAMFDMDSTLMMTPSTLVNELVTGLKPNVGKPAVPNDFILYNPNVRQKLQEELDNGLVPAYLLSSLLFALDSLQCSPHHVY